jgi:hypothetical protein
MLKDFRKRELVIIAAAVALAAPLTVAGTARVIHLVLDTDNDPLVKAGDLSPTQKAIARENHKTQ